MTGNDYVKNDTFPLAYTIEMKCFAYTDALQIVLTYKSMSIIL